MSSPGLSEDTSSNPLRTLRTSKEDASGRCTFPGGCGIVISKPLYVYVTSPNSKEASQQQINDSLPAQKHYKFIIIKTPTKTIEKPQESPVPIDPNCISLCLY